MVSVSPHFRVALGLGLLGVVLAASNVLADSTDARCDIYPKGADKPSHQYLCVFSQRQGYVTIDRGDGVYYDFRPVGDDPGRYQDSEGQAVYRQSGLGKEGLIFKLETESVYVYWDTSGLE
ncbi:hypothetical protein C9I98_07540 [Photobacterium sanctipauli]|uniref:Uncharacterized protein n=1 Tax=Photobacterium sanctipauli TaxID=1342794 RepID=A0A2T3NWR6_9GAMM|nr:hypothetical protein [Photobacterium sanctipauli]PSW20691.1 hypothetical protein C9I98_07540 [Photobacterium sanctipauli]